MQINTNYEMKNLLRDWKNCNKIKCFEIEVIDNRTNENEFILFLLEIRGAKFVATHEALTAEQETSELIATVEIDIDVDFDLDANLQELYNKCIDAITNSDFFELV